MIETDQSFINFINEYIEFFATNETIQMLSLNDDHVIYMFTLIVAVTCIFVICILNNFYQIK
jgi:hypothetical protein